MAKSRAEQGTVWQARDQFDMRLLKLAESAASRCWASAGALS